jgi:hypothetical protein
VSRSSQKIRGGREALPSSQALAASGRCLLVRTPCQHPQKQPPVPRPLPLLRYRRCGTLLGGWAAKCPKRLGAPCRLPLFGPDYRVRSRGSRFTRIFLELVSNFHQPGRVRHGCDATKYGLSRPESRAGEKIWRHGEDVEQMRTDTVAGSRRTRELTRPASVPYHQRRPGRINLLCVPGAPGRGPRRLVQLDISFGVQARRGELDRTALRRPPTLTRSS